MITPVPIILQNIGILLAGSILGPYAVLSVILFLLLAALGFPVLAGGRGGFSVFAGPSGGFLVGYIFAALVVGILVYVLWNRINFFTFLLCNSIGVLVLYLFGIPWLSIFTGVSLSEAMFVSLVYVPGDILKIILASYIAVQCKKHFPLIRKKRKDPSY